MESEIIRERILKRGADTKKGDDKKGEGEENDTNMETNAGGGGVDGASKKRTPAKSTPAKAPSNSGSKPTAPASATSTATLSSSTTPAAPKTSKEAPESDYTSMNRAPKTVKDAHPEAKAGKSRKTSSGVCSKRLNIAFRQLRSLGPDGPFGNISTPQDVTDLCEFVPPNDMDPNFGCPFVYLPWMGFLEGEDYEMIFPGEEPGVAFNSFVKYCQCHQGYELGCAAKVPHGPPTGREMYEDAAGEPKEVIVNSYSEFIPFGTPADRAEYCKMVGVWNGDFDSDIVEDFSSDVTECGCFFIGTAKDMVGTCPGVDLGAFFDRTDLTDPPTYFPTAMPSTPVPSTYIPTFSPSVDPTPGPTAAATTTSEVPTGFPTPSPTESPTFFPTHSPTFLECYEGEDGVLYPICPGSEEDELCDGTQDACNTDMCGCDLGVKFCEGEENPCIE